MQPSASPRHPWKALAAVIAMLVLADGALPHVGPHRQAGHAVAWTHGDVDCPDIDVHLEDADPDGPVIHVFDGGDWG